MCVCVCDEDEPNHIALERERDSSCKINKLKKKERKFIGEFIKGANNFLSLWSLVVVVVVEEGVFVVL